MNLQTRLRRVHHITSVATAIRIIQSKSIWSNDPGSPANFSVNADCVDHLDEPKEVSLTFSYSGKAYLVPFEFEFGEYEKDTLYLHVTDGLYRQKIERLKIWAARWPTESSKGMTCNGFQLFHDYHADLRREPFKQLMVRRLIEVLGSGVQLQVPSQGTINAKLRTSDPSCNYGVLATLRQRFTGKNPMSESSIWCPLNVQN